MLCLASRSPQQDRKAQPDDGSFLASLLRGIVSFFGGEKPGPPKPEPVPVPVEPIFLF